MSDATREDDGGNVVAFVVSPNLMRRHLDDDQRAMAAAKIANLLAGRPGKTAQICAVSQDDAADMLKVSRRSVQHANKVLTKGAPDLIEAAQSGRISGSAAADVAELPKQEQAEIVAPRATEKAAAMALPVPKCQYSSRANKTIARSNVLMACVYAIGARRHPQCLQTLASLSTNSLQSGHFT